MDKLNKTFGEEDTLYPSDMNAITSKIDDVIDYIGNGKLVINVNGAKYNDDFSANSAEDVEININTPSIFIPKGFNPDEKADSEEEAEEYEIEHDEGVITLKWWQGDRKEYEYAVHNVAIRDEVSSFWDIDAGFITTYLFEIDFDINMNNTVIGENLSLITDDETGAYHVEQSSHIWYINGRNPKNNINGKDIPFFYAQFVMDFGNTNVSIVDSITKYTGVVHCEALLTINHEDLHNENIRRAFIEGVLQYLKGYLCLNQNRC